MTQANFSETKLLTKIHNLSTDYQQLVQDFVEMLFQKEQQKQRLTENPVDQSSINENDEQKSHGYGSWAGQIIMSDDFDEPLEDLAEYM